MMIISFVYEMKLWKLICDAFNCVLSWSIIIIVFTLAQSTWNLIEHTQERNELNLFKFNQKRNSADVNFFFSSFELFPCSLFCIQNSSLVAGLLDDHRHDGGEYEIEFYILTSSLQVSSVDFHRINVVAEWKMWNISTRFHSSRHSNSNSICSSFFGRCCRGKNEIRSIIHSCFVNLHANFLIDVIYFYFIEIEFTGKFNVEFVHFINIIVEEKFEILKKKSWI